MARGDKEVTKLQRQVRKQRKKINLLQLYPSDRGLLQPLKEAQAALKAAAGDDSGRRAAIDGFFGLLPEPDPAAPPPR